MADQNPPHPGGPAYDPTAHQPQPPAAPEPPGAPFGQAPAAPQYGGQQYGEQQYGGQPPTGDQPYAAPGAPYGGAPGAPFVPAGAPEPKKGRGKRTALIIVAVVAVLGLLCCGGIFLFGKNFLGNTATDAKVGDCLSGDEITGPRAKTSALKIVKCDDSKARYKVVGRVSDKTQAEAVDALCQPFVDQGAQVIYWQEKSVNAGKGNVLCLAPNK